MVTTILAVLSNLDCFPLLFVSQIHDFVIRIVDLEEGMRIQPDARFFPN